MLFEKKRVTIMCRSGGGGEREREHTLKYAFSDAHCLFTKVGGALEFHSAKTLHRFLN